MKDSQIHIALVGYTFFSKDTRLIRHARNLARCGYHVDVITLKESESDNLASEKNITVHGIHSRDYGRQKEWQVISDYTTFTFLCFVKLLKNHFRIHKYDLIHINNMPNYLIFSATLFKALKVPILLDIHDTMPEIYMDKYQSGTSRFISRILCLEERISMKFADYVITTEHTKLERLLQNGLNKKHDVVLNIPDPEMMIVPVNSKERRRHHPFKIVYHGTFAERLGLDVAIEAIRIIRKKSDIQFYIIGDGEHRKKLQQMIIQYGMENEVFLSDGFITPHEVYIQISDADLAILPSRIGSATSLMLPVKLLEYAWLGIPCISSRTKTISHYFDEEMIMFTDSDTPEAFASKIMMVIKNESLRQHYSSSIRKFYNKFSFFEERERYTNIITSMLSLTNRLHDNSKPVSNTYKHIV